MFGSNISQGRSQTQQKTRPKVFTFKPPRTRTFKANDLLKPFRTYGRLHPVKRRWC